MSHRRMPKTNRWDCLKPEGSPDNNNDINEDTTRVNRFKSSSSSIRVNSRWKRSNSPEKRSNSPDKKFNTFKTRSRGGYDRSGRRGYDRGGGRGSNFRNNRRRRGGPSIFDDIKRDKNGRPMLEGAVSSGIDITAALKTKPVKISNKERKKQREAQRKKEKEEAIEKRKKEDERQEEEQKKLKQENNEWHKAMLERFMYEDSSSEDEDEEIDED